jgi:hypothetical protein
MKGANFLNRLPELDLPGTRESCLQHKLQTDRAGNLLAMEKALKNMLMAEASFSFCSQNCRKGQFEKIVTLPE